MAKKKVKKKSIKKKSTKKRASQYTGKLKIIGSFDDVLKVSIPAPKKNK